MKLKADTKQRNYVHGRKRLQRYAEDICALNLIMIIKFGKIKSNKQPGETPAQTESNMIVKKLELVNFQVIKEFNADFDGNVYFITGDNELGKSTVLKAIGALLTGNRDAVLRNGESKGFAKMIVGDDGEEYEVYKGKPTWHVINKIKDNRNEKR